MRKAFDKKTKHYTALEHRQQLQISAHFQQQAQHPRLQDYLIHNYFQ